MRKTALLFAGQGAQVVGTGKDFFEKSSLARALFEKANATLGVDLRSVCFEGPEEKLTNTEFAQPGIYLVSWVAFQLLKERGLSFQATAGLSLGEFTALAAAGVFSFEDGLRVVRDRGRFMREACESAPGSMAAVIGLDEAATREVCAATGVELANLNCPGQIVISGEQCRIEQACLLAREKGAKRALPLAVAGAYHSSLMASAAPRLDGVLGAVPMHLPSVPVIGNVSAQPHGQLSEIHASLVRQVTSPVRWEESMRCLLAMGFTRFIELGPGAALSGFMRRIAPAGAVEVLSVSNMDGLDAVSRALAPVAAQPVGA